MKQSLYKFCTNPLVVTGCPGLLLFAYILTFGVNVPYYDDWSMLPELKAWCEGTLGFEHIVATGNEHRMVFPRVITMILHRLFSVNMVVLMVASLCCMGLLVWILALDCRNNKRSIGCIWAIPICLFTLNAYENWLWSFQFTLVFATVMSLITLWFFSRALSVVAELSGKWFRLSVLGLFVSVFSAAHGLVLLPTGLALFGLQFIQRGGQWPRHFTRMLVLWCLFAVILITIYFSLPGYNAGRVDGLFPYNDLGLVFRYTLTLLGAPIFPHRGTVVLFFGAWVLLSSILLPIYILLRQRALSQTSVFWAGVWGYSLLANLLVIYGRAVLGEDSAIVASRYLIFTGPLILSSIMLLENASLQKEARLLSWRNVHRLQLLVLFGSVALMARNGYVAGKNVKMQRQELVPILQTFDVVEFEQLRKLHRGWPVTDIYPLAEFLREFNFSVFHSSPSESE